MYTLSVCTGIYTNRTLNPYCIFSVAVQACRFGGRTGAI